MEDMSSPSAGIMYGTPSRCTCRDGVEEEEGDAADVDGEVMMVLMRIPDNSMSLLCVGGVIAVVVRGQDRDAASSSVDTIKGSNNRSWS